MNVTLMTLAIGPRVFSLVFDEGARTSYVEYQKKNYRDLVDLVHEVKGLSEVKNLSIFVKIANFMFQGSDFEVIEDIQEFKNRYASFSQHLSQYGKYDISEIEGPKIVDGTVVFYVEHQAMHIPYRVTCTYPFEHKNARYCYELLKEIIN